MAASASLSSLVLNKIINKNKETTNKQQFEFNLPPQLATDSLGLSGGDGGCGEHCLEGTVGEHLFDGTFDEHLDD